MFCWHKWKKWGPLQETIASGSPGWGGYYAVVQMRECDKCGKIQAREVKDMRKVPA